MPQTELISGYTLTFYDEVKCVDLPVPDCRGTESVCEGTGTGKRIRFYNRYLLIETGRAPGLQG
jgi:hypothetical protein